MFNVGMQMFVRTPRLGHNFGCNICCFCCCAEYFFGCFLYKEENTEEEERYRGLA